MGRLKAIIGIVVTAIVVCFLISGCSSPASVSTTTTSPQPTPTASTPNTVATPSGDPIKIGHYFSETGPFAGTAEYVIPGVEMAVEEINAAGGVLGRPIEMIFKDDQLDPQVVVSVLNDLKSEGCVAIQGGVMSTTALAASAWAEENKMPHVSGGSNSWDFAKTFNRYTFTPSFSAKAHGSLMAQAAYEQGVKSVYIIGANVNLPLNVAKVCKEELQKLDPSVKIVGEQWVSPTEMEFSNLISNALALKPDMIMDLIAGPPAVNFIKQGQLFDIFNKTKVFAIYGLDTSATTAFGNEYPENMQTSSTCPFWDSSQAGIYEFGKKYFTKTGKYPNEKVIEDYLATYWIVNAIKKANSTDAEKIVDALVGLTIDSPYGPVTMIEYDHHATYPMFWCTTGYSPDYPIVIGTTTTKYTGENNIYLTPEEFQALKEKS